jgi:hypothetical protein
LRMKRRKEKHHQVGWCLLNLRIVSNYLITNLSISESNYQSQGHNWPP